MTFRYADENVALQGDNLEFYEASERLNGEEMEPRPTFQHTRPKPRPRRLDPSGEERTKSVVDPRKYKTKLCRNWKATGQCPYEHTCCYAHGETETRTVHQNNNVLSSLGYFSGVMLMAMKDEKQGPERKYSRQGKKPPTETYGGYPHRSQGMGNDAPSHQNSTTEPNTPTVHSPYCLPEGPNFGMESNPASPLGVPDPHMPSYSFRMEVPKSPSFSTAYGPYPETMVPIPPYDGEYCVAVPMYSPFYLQPVAHPLFTPAYPSCYDAYYPPILTTGFPEPGAEAMADKGVTKNTSFEGVGSEDHSLGPNSDAADEFEE